MPLRPIARSRTWLLPPTLDELIPADHPARFVGMLVDSLSPAEWAAMGIAADGNHLGAPGYDPRALLSVWLYGFMTGVRSSRKLEAACREQLAYRWLTGWQLPDHNTLWRFYQAHREELRQVLKRTVRTAVHCGLVDLAVQAVDGSKLVANAARTQTLSAADLEALLQRAEAAIAELEAQNAAGEDGPPVQLPPELVRAEALRKRVRQALARATTEEAGQANVTDPEATLMKTRQGTAPAFNAQAVVAPLLPGNDGGRPASFLITGTGIAPGTADSAQLLPMIDQAADIVGRSAALTLADAGYHSGANLAACAARGQAVAMPEAHERHVKAPYHQTRFSYGAAGGQYRCPEGNVLPFVGLMTNSRHPGQPPYRVYQAAGATCQACPAFTACTINAQGRRLHISPYAGDLRRHRAWMATPEAQAGYARRKTLVEPVFGILKEQFGARRVLLRGVVNVRAEWTLLAVGFNLRSLWRCWVAGRLPQWTSTAACPAPAA